MKINERIYADSLIEMVEKIQNYFRTYDPFVYGVKQKNRPMSMIDTNGTKKWWVEMSRYQSAH